MLPSGRNAPSRGSGPITRRLVGKAIASQFAIVAILAVGGSPWCVCVCALVCVCVRVCERGGAQPLILALHPKSPGDRRAWWLVVLSRGVVRLRVMAEDWEQSGLGMGPWLSLSRACLRS